MGSLQLLSPAVVAIIAIGPLLLGATAGRTRQLAFLALNLTFLVACVFGVPGTAITLGFAALGYGLIRLGRTSSGWTAALAATAFVLLFVYMKRYTFLEMLLPDGLLTTALSTVGLSFLFFKVLHVFIDARSGTLGSVDALTYLNYCTNFATFAMGPIQRYQDHRGQWEDTSSALSFEGHLDAVIRILVGFVKAYVLAELAGEYVGYLTQDPAERATGELFAGVYAFNLYLYLNFAGYCDVVIGAGTLMGLRPPENFNKPFLATNVADFWQRQHRSLTLWLTDYVFTPAYKWLLERRRPWLTPLVAISISLMMTMLVSGLWHGTSVGFLLFGLVHGAYLVIYRMWDAGLTQTFGLKAVRAWRRRWWVKLLGMVVTFNAVSFAFVFFLLDAPTAVRVLGRLIWP